jgi:hypothetical protein
MGFMGRASDSAAASWAASADKPLRLCWGCLPPGDDDEEGDAPSLQAPVSSMLPIARDAESDAEPPPLPLDARDTITVEAAAATDTSCVVAATRTAGSGIDIVLL